MRRLAWLGLLAALLAGCAPIAGGACSTMTACAALGTGPFAGPGGQAVYVHRGTGDIQHCVNNAAGGGDLVGAAVWAGSYAAAYADCKTALETKGYERIP